MSKIKINSEAHPFLCSTVEKIMKIMNMSGKDEFQFPLILTASLLWVSLPCGSGPGPAASSMLASPGISKPLRRPTESEALEGGLQTPVLTSLLGLMHTQRLPGLIHFPNQ